MKLSSTQLYIDGMTCINCQNKIEKKLRKTAGIEKVSVSYSKGIAEVTYDAAKISVEDMTAIIEDLGYEAGTQRSGEQTDVARTVSLLVIVIALYVILQQYGILNLLVPSQLADTGMGYGMLFVIGLITSVHCIAMCGGINLTQCIPGKDASPEEGGWATFRPAALYNLGRVISYTVIGFILGLAGLVIGGGSGAGVPVLLQGILKLIAGVFMVIMGINMLGLFPWLRRFTLRMPRFLAVRIGRQKGKSKQPLVVGLLNGLMPCGPLQSMQIVALASGNPFAGALSMFLFSLGTVPLMLGLGSVVSALGRKFTQKVMSIGAVLVLVLGLAMLSQGGSLSGMLPPGRLLALIIVLSVLGVVASLPVRRTAYKAAGIAVTAVVLVAGMTVCHYTMGKEEGESVAADTATVTEEGIQVINSTLSPGTYPDITVQAGIPVKWMIDAPSGSINGCNYKMLLSQYGIEYSFSEGENIIEFTPEETGSYDYTCWMGMIHGTIHVIDGDGTGTDGATQFNENEVEQTPVIGQPGSCCA